MARTDPAPDPVPGLDAPPSGPAVLRRLRRAAGLSQTDLAARAGISARTVRGLERGTVSQPRSSSVELLCDALGLDAEQRRRLLTGWDARPASTDGPTDAGARQAELLAALGLSGSGPSGVGRHETVAAHDVVSITDRHLDFRECDLVLRSPTDRLARVALVLDRDDAPDPGLLQVQPLCGAEVVDRSFDAGRGAAAFVLGLSRTLDRGEHHRLRLRLTCPARAAGPVTGVARTVSDPMTVASLHVRFHGEPPHQLRATGQDDAPPVPLNADGSAVQVWATPAPGRHGLHWRWSS